MPTSFVGFGVLAPVCIILIIFVAVIVIKTIIVIDVWGSVRLHPKKYFLHPVPTSLHVQVPLPLVHVEEEAGPRLLNPPADVT